MSMAITAIKDGNGRPTLKIFDGDIPHDLLVDLKASINHQYTPALIPLDTETRGLKFQRDRLCLIQFAVNVRREHSGGWEYYAVKTPLSLSVVPKNLFNLLASDNVQMLIHFSQFDLPFLFKRGLVLRTAKTGWEQPRVFCTRTASKIVRTYGAGHSLKDVVEQYAGVKLEKKQQTTDWGGELSDDQLHYACDDILYLPQVYQGLLDEAKREGIEQVLWDAMDRVLPNARLKFAGYDPVELGLDGY